VTRLALLLMAVALSACATVRPGTPVLPDDATGPHAELYVFNVSRGTMIPFRRYVDIDGYPLVRLWRETWQRIAITPGPHEVVMDGQRVRLDATDGGVYYVAVGYHPRREWLKPVGSHPIFVRRITEADALRLFTEMKRAE
jgi:hypothetical protein